MKLQNSVTGVVRKYGFVLLFLVLCTTVFAARFKYEIIASRCVGCGDCVRICTFDAVVIHKGKAVIDFDKCTSCAQCKLICSYQAVRKWDLQAVEQESQKSDE